jgi:type I restriction enzyme S subunit
MSKPEKKGLVPELRFPEYQDNGGWDENKLSELVTTVTPPKKLPTNLYQAVGLYPIIDQSQSNICGWTNDKESLISDNFPLIIFGDHTCILKIAREPFAQGADGIKILKAKDQVEAEFLYGV